MYDYICRNLVEHFKIVFFEMFLRLRLSKNNKIIIFTIKNKKQHKVILPILFYSFFLLFKNDFYQRYRSENWEYGNWEEKW